MKKFIFGLSVALLTATSAMAFSIPDVTKSAGDVKFKTCLSQEAQNAFTRGELTSENLEAKSVEISSTCAQREAMKSTSDDVKLAKEILAALLK